MYETKLQHADAIYQRKTAEAGLFDVAFLGVAGSADQQATLRRFWRESIREAGIVDRKIFSWRQGLLTSLDKHARMRLRAR